MPVPKRQLVAEQWDQFARTILPPGCPESQRREMRRAFYAGGEMLLIVIMQALSPGDDANPEDLQTMDAIHKELQDFAALVKAGRA